MKGWEPRGSVWPSKPGKPNFLAGISGGCPQVFQKVCVQFSDPNEKDKKKHCKMEENHPQDHHQSERVFASKERASGFPEKGADLGNFRGTSALLLCSTARSFRECRRRTSGEVRGLSRSSGEPDSLPATRQIR